MNIKGTVDDRVGQSRGRRWQAGRLGPVVAILLLIGIMVVGAACGGQQAAAPDATVQTIPVRVMTTAKGNLQQTVQVSGELEAEREVYLSAKTGGTVESVNAQPGDLVKSGQAIVTLDDTDVRLQVQQASAGLQAARAGVKQAEEGARPEQLAQLQAGVDQATANLTQAQTDYDRMKTLYDAGAISKQTLEQSQLRVTVAQSQVEQATKQLEIAKQGATDAQKDAARAQLAQAQAAYQLAQGRLDDMKLTAPFDAVVGMVDASEGQLLGPGTPAVRLVDMSSMKLQVGVDATVVNSLARGQVATVRIPSLDKEVQATIHSVAPAADPRTKQFAVELQVPNSDGTALRPGMLAEAVLVRGQVSDDIVIPLDAVINRGENNSVVYVVESGVAHEQQVALGIDNGQDVAVTDGLQAGVQIVIQGQEYLTDGAPVEIQTGEVGGSTK